MQIYSCLTTELKFILMPLVYQTNEITQIKWKYYIVCTTKAQRFSDTICRNFDESVLRQLKDGNQEPCALLQYVKTCQFSDIFLTICQSILIRTTTYLSYIEAGKDN